MVVAGRFIGAGHGNLPQLRESVRVEGVHEIVFRGHEYDVVSGSRDAKIRNVERLGIRKACHRQKPELAKETGVNVERGENRLVQILAGAPIIVVVGEDRLVGRRRQRRTHGKRCGIAGRGACSIGDDHQEL